MDQIRQSAMIELEDCPDSTVTDVQGIGFDTIVHAKRSPRAVIKRVFGMGAAVKSIWESHPLAVALISGLIVMTITFALQIPLHLFGLI